ncbi:hypothetical protein [Paraburkholderia saeva]|uniref:Uncharacterized protein n=1 Tax=Paraburkholderia saeva TaxID=2777537 RepID=A0A9N8X3W3_9BURK|nr:hypothetical protein [Paraburkholderia saeva]CAG4905743.1 hypothetical protein LMG31841_03482 [Paraburkholderia saeva]
MPGIRLIDASAIADIASADDARSLVGDRLAMPLWRVVREARKRGDIRELHVARLLTDPEVLVASAQGGEWIILQ